MNLGFDINNPKTWTATCCECGCKRMEFMPNTYRYVCPKCGNNLEV